MKKFRQLVGAVLVLLLANPVCCCTIGTILHGPEAVQAAHSCCSQMGNHSTPDTPAPVDDGSRCPCAADKPALVEGHLAELVRHDSVALVIDFPAPMALVMASASPEPLATPATSLPPPPRPWLRYCRFLL